METTTLKLKKPICMGSEKTMLWKENIVFSTIARNKKITYAEIVGQYQVILEVACIGWYTYKFH